MSDFLREKDSTSFYIKYKFIFVIKNDLNVASDKYMFHAIKKVIYFYNKC